ncbi:MAG: response regulator [Planctomycetes bacterium]|nr:response regulator [Planctomycetota bacterium]
MSKQRSPHILVVDDEQFILHTLQLYFESNGFQVSTASGGAAALEIFSRKQQPVDVVILDLVMPGTHGLDLLRDFKKDDSDVQVIIATGCGSMGSAVEALRLGAFDFITKPILDFDRDLMKSVQNALEVRRARLQAGGEGPDEAGDPGVAEAAIHSLGVFEKLNDLAATHVNRHVTPKTLQSVWRVLADAFAADAAAILERRTGGAWETISSWELSAPIRFQSDWHREIAQRLPAGIFGSYCIEVSDSAGCLALMGLAPPAQAARPAGKTPAASTRPKLQASKEEGWTHILHLPLVSEGGAERLLLVFYRSEKAAALKTTTDALALLSSVLSLLFFSKRSAIEAEPVFTASDEDTVVAL